MNDETQPLTDAELRTIRAFVEQAKIFNPEGFPLAFRDRERLLAEVDRLRAENTAQDAKLAAIRELRRTWFQNADVVRGKADTIPGLTEVERAELRQGAVEMEHCARRVGLELGPTPEEEPDFIVKDLDRRLCVGDTDRRALGLDQGRSDNIEGLCGNRDDHAPHPHDSASLGHFWCHADQTKRLPYALERRKDAR